MIRVRPWQDSDLAAAHAINEAAVPAVNSLSEADLQAQVAESLLTLVAEEDNSGRIVGFLLCYGEGAAYQSTNYLWFSARYGAFAYVDRVAVDPNARSRGIGASLYDALEAELAGRKPYLLCEVSAKPANLGSLRFHQRRGFVEVGRQTFDDGAKEVVMLARKLPAAP